MPKTPKSWTVRPKTKIPLDPPTQLVGNPKP